MSICSKISNVTSVVGSYIRGNLPTYSKMTAEMQSNSFSKYVLDNTNKLLFDDDKFDNIFRKLYNGTEDRLAIMDPDVGEYYYQLAQHKGIQKFFTVDKVIGGKYLVRIKPEYISNGKIKNIVRNILSHDFVVNLISNLKNNNIFGFYRQLGYDYISIVKEGDGYRYIPHMGDEKIPGALITRKLDDLVVKSNDSSEAALTKLSNQKDFILKADGFNFKKEIKNGKTVSFVDDTDKLKTMDTFLYNLNFGTPTIDLLKKKTFLRKVYTSLYVTTATLYGFIKYGFSAAGVLLAVLTGVPVFSLRKALISGENYKQIDKIRKDAGILDGGIYDFKHTVLTEVEEASGKSGKDWFSAVYDGIVKAIDKALNGVGISENIRKSLLDKMEEYKGGIHNLAEYLFIDQMKTIAFKQALEDFYGIGEYDLLHGKVFTKDGNLFFKDIDGNISYIDTVAEIERKANEIVSMHRGYDFIPVYNRLNNPALNTFNKFFNFYGTWGYLMLRNFGGYIYQYFKLGIDIKKIDNQISALKEQLKNGEKGKAIIERKIEILTNKRNTLIERYQMAKTYTHSLIGQLLQAGFYGAQINKFNDDNDNVQNNKLKNINTLIGTMSVFSTFLQMFDSSIYGRVISGLGSDLIHGDSATEIGYDILKEGQRDFLKNFSLLNPVAGLATDVISGKDKDEAVHDFLTQMFDTEGFVRFLDPSVSKYYADYGLPYAQDSVIKYLTGKGNDWKQLYYDLKDKKNLLKWAKEDPFYKAQALLYGAIHGLPVIKGIYRQLYGDDGYMDKYEQYLKIVDNDETVQNAIYHGQAPIGGDLDGDKRKEYYQYFDSELGKYFRYNASFYDKQIRQLMGKTLETEYPDLANNVAYQQLQEAINSGNDALLTQFVDNYVAIANQTDLTPEQQNRERAFIALQALLEAHKPGSSAVLLGYLYNRMKDAYAQYILQNPKAHFNKLTQEQRDQVLEQLAPRFINALSFTFDKDGNGSINGIMFQKLLEKYVTLKYPETKDWFIKNGHTIDEKNPLFRVILTHNLADYIANNGDISAIDAKNIFGLLMQYPNKDGGKGLTKEDRAEFMANVLDQIHKTGADKTTLTNMTLGILAANIDVMDDIVNNTKEAKDIAKNTKNKLIKYLFTVRKNINDFARQEVVKQAAEQNVGSVGGRYFNPGKSYYSSRGMYNAFNKRYGKNYGKLYNAYKNTRGYSNGTYHYYPKDVYLPKQYPQRQYQKPEYKHYQYPARLNQAFSQRIIYELTKRDVPRNYGFKGTYRGGITSIFGTRKSK